jgi:Amt family ammonium transporter
MSWNVPFMVWLVYNGFNPGSTLGISGGQGYTAALCAVTTTMAAACGAMSCVCLRSLWEFAYDIACVMNGGLSGLVAIPASCSVVTPWAAIIIGTVAGWVCIAADALLIKFKIDDAVNAIPVHLANGALALIATGLFAAPIQVQAAGYSTNAVGVFYGGGALLGAHICCLVFVLIWVGATMTPFFFTLNYFNLLRVDRLEEVVGLDISHHKVSAYSMTTVDQTIRRGSGRTRNTAISGAWVQGKS